MIKHIEFVGEGYKISFKEDALELLKGNNELYNKFVSCLREETTETIEEIILDDYKSSFINICRENGFDLREYLLESNVIHVTSIDGAQYFITNQQLGSLWNFHNYAELIVCNYYENYLMVTMNDCGGQVGALGIWDHVSRTWISSKEEPYTYGILYAQEIEKFIGLYSIGQWGLSELGITVMDIKDDFNSKEILFYARGYKYENGTEEPKVNDEKQYEIELNSDVLVKLSKCRNRVITIEGQLEMYWDGSEKACYVREVNKLYMYKF